MNVVFIFGHLLGGGGIICNNKEHSFRWVFWHVAPSCFVKMLATLMLESDGVMKKFI